MSDKRGRLIDSLIPVIPCVGYRVTEWQASVQLQTVASLHVYQHSKERRNRLNKKNKSYITYVLEYRPHFEFHFTFCFIAKKRTVSFQHKTLLFYNYMAYIFFCKNISISSEKILRYWVFFSWYYMFSQ